MNPENVTRPNSANTVNIEDFFDKASEKGVAEIDAARTAVEKAEVPEVKKFAEQMIRDHESANQKLRAIAAERGIALEDDASLVDKAKKAGLGLLRGETFDHAYLRNQISEHEKVVNLFEDAAGANDPQIKAFAEETLPTLREHLDHARKIYATVA